MATAIGTTAPTANFALNWPWVAEFLVEYVLANLAPWRAIVDLVNCLSMALADKWVEYGNVADK